MKRIFLIILLQLILIISICGQEYKFPLKISSTHRYLVDLSKAQNIVTEEVNDTIQNHKIKIDPNYPMWFIHNGLHPFLVGVSESGSISNLWGDPGEEWNIDGSRKSIPVTHPTNTSFLWSEYLDSLTVNNINCVREIVLPYNLSDPANYNYHYNPYPFPWVRTDSNKNYIPGYRENKDSALTSAGKINSNYLHSEAIPDFSKPQADYFRYRVKRFCDAAEFRNIYVILTIFPISPYFPYEPDNINVKAYINMLLESTKDNGNVLFEINWEGGNGDYFTWWAGYLKEKLIKEGRPPNVILVNHGLVRPPVDHSTVNSTIVGHHREHSHNSLLTARQYNKPVIWTEDFDEGKSNKHNKEIADVVRDRSWYSFTAGVQHIWYDWSMRFGSYRDPIFFKAASSVVTFINETHLPFWTMAPHDSLALGKDNFVLADPGEQYVVYFSMGVEKGTTIKLPSASFSAKWFNPGLESVGTFLGQSFKVAPDGVIAPPEGSYPNDKLVLYIFQDSIPGI